ncbi:MAG: TRAP transporter large permease [Candidatus Sumerlaeia bacterium]
MSQIEMGMVGCIFLLILLMSSMPVAFAMAVVGFFGFAWLVNPQAAMHMLTVDIYDTFSSHSLTVIPLFVLMGQVAFHSGISRRLFQAAYTWMGSLPGGLAMATIGACTGFGAICGSGPATSATMTAVALPEMKRYKYSMELGAGSVAAGGSLGMLIPPSVVFIVYGIMTEESVGDLFLAGILPGLLIAALFCGTIYLNCKRRPALGPAGPKTSFIEKVKALGGVFETALLFLMVMGGMFFGIFTPTEAAAIGAFGSLLIAFAKGQLSWNTLFRSLQETVRTSCMVMIIVAGATVFGHFLARTQIPSALAMWLAGLPLPGTIIMGLVILFYLIAGCFVDALALVLLTIPIFQPVVTELGFDLVWFGVIIVVVTQMGVITPPVGVCAYIVSGIARDVPLQTVFKGAMPFLLALIIAAILLIIFPEISLFLPNLADHGIPATP